MKRARLIVLLVLLGCCCVVAVIVLVRRSEYERCSSEIYAQHALRDYMEAQSRFRCAALREHGQLVFADSLQKLKGLLPPEMIAAHGPGGKPWRGYLFLEMKTIAGVPIDWRREFAMCAIPARYGRDGYRTFIVATDRLLLGKDLNPPAFPDDYPDDVCSTGWYIDG
jgi:hypothetical protein